MERIVLVGSGHLARALWEGWQRNLRATRRITILARSGAHRDLWEPDVWSDSVVGDPYCLGAADVVVLAVKPKDVTAAMASIRAHCATTVVISPVAGWSIHDLRTEGAAGPVVRIMPNVCAAVGASTTLAAWDGLDGNRRAWVMGLLEDCGSVTVIDEHLMNPYTALIGSGPAYVFLLLEALIESGRQLGADGERTRWLVSAMMEGAARLARDRSEDALADWIRQVASPGGTTEALLAVLQDGGWPDLIQEAVVAASQRAQQLGAGIPNP